MKILTLSGSARTDSYNIKLLKAIPALFPAHEFVFFDGLSELPLFHADLQEKSDPVNVTKWKTALSSADAVIISTPAYIKNIPAVLKNALEWVTDSGEMANKKTLGITFTPYAPRGEKAMQSLLWSLQALNANIVAQLPLYQNEIAFDNKETFIENEHLEVLQEAVKYLLS